MEMPVHGFDGCPVEGYNKVVVDARNHSGVRYAKIPATMSMKPQQDANVKWQVVSPETVGNASATGYFFGRMLEQTHLDKVEWYLATTECLAPLLHKYAESACIVVGVVAHV